MNQRTYFDPFEEINFEKWVSSELGAEIVKSVRECPYINSGQMKNVIDYIFENMYPQNYVKLIDLNLNLDGLNLSKEEFNQDDELTKLKKELIETTKKLNETKQLNRQYELDLSGLNRENSQLQEELDDKNMLDKQVNLMLLENSLKKRKDLRIKIETASEKLTNILDWNSNETKSNELESVIHHLNNLKTHKVSTNTPRKTDERFTHKMNKISLKELSKYFESKINEEIQKLNQISDERQVQNEINLIKYQMSTSNETEMTSNEQTPSSLAEAIKQEFMNMIIRTTERIKYNNDKEMFDKEFKIHSNQLYEYLKKNYTPTDTKLYARYLKTYFMLKRMESNLDELKKLMEQFGNESKFYSQSFIDKQAKYDQIKQQELLVHERQLKLENLLNEMFDFYSNKATAELNHLKLASEQLSDSIRLFNSNNQLLLNSKSDTTIILDSSKLHLSIPKYNQTNQLQSSTSLNTNELSLNLLEEFLKLKNSNQAKCFLFSNLVDNYLSLVKSIELLNSNDELISDKEVDNLVNDLTNASVKSAKIDDEINQKYFHLIVSKIDECNQVYENIPRIEELLSTWWNQPAAYNCLIDNLTVDSKQLNYYVNYVDEAIENNKNKI